MRKRLLFRTFILGILIYAIQQSGFSQSRNTALPPAFVPDSLINSNTSNLPDTIKLQYYFLSDITKYYEFKDSTLDNFFHQYDPVKRRGIDYINLGNAGSAARSMDFNANPYIGFNIGLNQYDVYNYTLDDFRFFENTT